MNTIESKDPEAVEYKKCDKTLEQLNFELSAKLTPTTHTAFLELVKLLELFINIK